MIKNPDYLAWYIVGAAGGVMISTLMSTTQVRLLVSIGLALFALGIFISAGGADNE